MEEGQGSIPVHGLAFWSPFPKLGCLLSLDAAGRGIILPQPNVPGCYRKMSPGRNMGIAL